MLYVRSNGGAWQVYYIYRDYQGSITHITNSSGTLVQELSYDAWGRLRNPDTQVAYAPDAEPALFLGRGYTGHEHLQQFGLINMNARLYDPALGRFLSPDPYVQSPDFTQNFNRYSYCLNNPLKYTDPDGEIVWFIPVIYFAVYAAIEYGTQVYYNYQVNKQLESQGLKGLSNKEKWIGRIDWFDVAVSGAAGAISSIAPPLAPWIMYGTPLLTNAVNVYGDGQTQNVFDGSIPIGQYAFNSLVEIGSLYATNVIKTGLATSNKDIWNPSNHTKYFTKEMFGKIITARSVEDVFQQVTASWVDYSIKAPKYPEFNPDRLWFPDGTPVFPPQTPNPLVIPPYYREFKLNNIKNNDVKRINLEKYLRLKTTI